MKIILIKGLDNKFSIPYNSDYDVAKKLKVNQEYMFEVKKSRNIKFHRKYWALVNMLFDNQERYDNINDLRYDLTVASGFFTLRENIAGETIKVPNSISFASMDEFAFGELYSKTLDVIVKYFNFDRQDIIDNVEQYF